MKLKRIECEQFAGLLNKELEFENGLNIVVGENESGKSTLVDLIYQILFKDVKLDGRSDSDFIDQYFPKKVSGVEGDIIDGVLQFETANGTYELKKEWEKGQGSCKLALPDGTLIKDNATINKVLLGELKHRAGVYNEIIFASQKRNQIAVESIMKALSKKSDSLSETRADLKSTLTQVSLETGGASLDQIESRIKKLMDDLIGRWDRNADAPEGGSKRASYKNAWVKDAGLIAKAYYDMDCIREMQGETQKAEKVVEGEKAQIHKFQEDKKEIETKRASFQKFRGLIGQRSSLLELVQMQDGKIREQENVLKDWPHLEADIAKAKGLQIKQNQAAVRELYKKAEEHYQTFEAAKKRLGTLRKVDSADIAELEGLITKKQAEEGKLAGINLVAKIKQLGPAPVEIKSVASENILDIVDGEIKITEAVDITIPGVLEMQLKPQGVDVEGIKSLLQQTKAEIEVIYEKYGINSIDELRQMETDYLTEKEKKELSEKALGIILGDKSWEKVKAENDALPVDVETKTKIECQIFDLCGSKSIDSFIGGLETTRDNYKEKYKDIESLQADIDATREEMKGNQDKLDSMEKIPEEFQGISSPDEYDASLQGKIDDYDSQIGACDDRRRLAEGKLGEKSAEEYSEELQEKSAIFEARKAEYKHWENIYNVFCRLKEQTAGNPVEDIEKNFRKYLQEITDGSLELNAMDEEMAVELASGTHRLTYSILSDGTKDTISLAFRLAMLEHLYPEGDGLAVFDDPFTDMDPKRVIQACKLIQKFAENNQVIFITCDEKYKKLMEGNVLSVTK